MPKIKYSNHRFHPESEILIQVANRFIETYAIDGYILTLRQLYYQFVANDFLPNSQESYNKLGNLINRARMCGRIDWNAIEDRTRNIKSLSHWNNPSEIINSAVKSYHTDWWKGQNIRIEVWIEKEALIGVVERACNKLDIKFFACRGYVSQSEMWVASQRIIDYNREGISFLLLHLGDHDPSGIDMTRDIIDRLYTFGADVSLNRIALNMDQVNKYNPPPNPAKMTDTRFKSYVDEYGTESWELDALKPGDINELIEQEVNKVINLPLMEQAKLVEKKEKEQLQEVADNWQGEE